MAAGMWESTNILLTLCLSGEASSAHAAAHQQSSAALTPSRTSNSLTNFHTGAACTSALASAPAVLRQHACRSHPA